MVLVHPGACLVLAMAPRASGMLCRGFVLSHSTEKTPKKDYLECRQLLHLPIVPSSPGEEEDKMVKARVEEVALFPEPV